MKLVALTILVFLFAACTASVKTFDPASGKPVSEIKVPIGFKWEETSRTLEADSRAIDAGVTLGTKALEVGGQAFAQRVADHIAEQAKQQEQAGVSGKQ